MLYWGVRCCTRGNFPRNSTKTRWISLAYQQSVTVSHIRFLGISTKGVFFLFPCHSITISFNIFPFSHGHIQPYLFPWNFNKRCCDGIPWLSNKICCNDFYWYTNKVLNSTISVIDFFGFPPPKYIAVYIHDVLISTCFDLVHIYFLRTPTKCAIINFLGIPTNALYWISKAFQLNRL